MAALKPALIPAGEGGGEPLTPAEVKPAIELAPVDEFGIVRVPITEGPGGKDRFGEELRPKGRLIPAGGEFLEIISGQAVRSDGFSPDSFSVKVLGPQGGVGGFVSPPRIKAKTGTTDNLMAQVGSVILPLTFDLEIAYNKQVVLFKNLHAGPAGVKLVQRDNKDRTKQIVEINLQDIRFKWKDSGYLFGGRNILDPEGVEAQAFGDDGEAKGETFRVKPLTTKGSRGEIHELHSSREILEELLAELEGVTGVTFAPTAAFAVTIGTQLVDVEYGERTIAAKKAEELFQDLGLILALNNDNSVTVHVAGKRSDPKVRPEQLEKEGFRVSESASAVTHPLPTNMDVIGAPTLYEVVLTNWEPITLSDGTDGLPEGTVISLEEARIRWNIGLDEIENAVLREAWNLNYDGTAWDDLNGNGPAFPSKDAALIQKRIEILQKTAYKWFRAVPPGQQIREQLVSKEAEAQARGFSNVTEGTLETLKGVNPNSTVTGTAGFLVKEAVKLVGDILNLQDQVKNLDDVAAGSGLYSGESPLAKGGARAALMTAPFEEIRRSFSLLGGEVAGAVGQAGIAVFADFFRLRLTQSDPIHLTGGAPVIDTGVTPSSDESVGPPPGVPPEPEDPGVGEAVGPPAAPPPPTVAEITGTTVAIPLEPTDGVTIAIPLEEPEEEPVTPGGVTTVIAAFRPRMGKHHGEQKPKIPKRTFAIDEKQTLAKSIATWDIHILQRADEQIEEWDAENGILKFKEVMGTPNLMYLDFSIESVLNVLTSTFEIEEGGTLPLESFISPELRKIMLWVRDQTPKVLKAIRQSDQELGNLPPTDFERILEVVNDQRNSFIAGSFVHAGGHVQVAVPPNFPTPKELINRAFGVPFAGGISTGIATGKFINSRRDRILIERGPLSFFSLSPKGGFGQPAIQLLPPKLVVIAGKTLDINHPFSRRLTQFKATVKDPTGEPVDTQAKPHPILTKNREVIDVSGRNNGAQFDEQAAELMAKEAIGPFPVTSGLGGKFAGVHDFGLNGLYARVTYDFGPDEITTDLTEGLSAVDNDGQPMRRRPNFKGTDWNR